MTKVYIGSAVSGGAVQTSPYLTRGEIGNVPVTATGSTTPRALKDRWSDVVNVKDFGARGDGVTDDANALRGMATTLGTSERTIVVSSPVYVGTDVTLPANLRVRFDGDGAFVGPGAVTSRRWGMPPRAHQTKTPIVTFIDDDGDIAALTRLKPVYDAAGIVGVIAIPSDYVGTTSHLTAANLLTFQSAGWEIASHTKTHFYLSGGATDSQIRYEMSASKVALEALGLRVNHLVYPGGNYDERATKIARDYYRSATIGGTTVLNEMNTGALRTWHLGRRDFPSVNSLAQHKSFVDQAIAANAWIIFFTHANASTLTDSDLTNLASLVAYIQSKNVPILTVDQALDRVGNLSDFGFYPWQNAVGDGYSTNPYFIVDSDGNVATNPRTAEGPGVIISALDAFDATSVPATFDAGKITVTTIDSPGASTFPEGVAGTLITHRLDNKGDGSDTWTFQQYFIGASSRSYLRAWNPGASAWRGWIPNQQTYVSPDDGFTANNVITDFVADKITRTKITAGGAGTFPESKAGQLFTERFISYDNTLARQRYEIAQESTTYVRYWKSTNAWSGWKLFATNAWSALTYSASVAVDTNFGDTLQIAITDGNAYTVANPTNARAGGRLTLTFKNSSGGALGADTAGNLYKTAGGAAKFFNAADASGITKPPANGYSRSVTFVYNGTNWIEVSRTPADVPN